MLFSIRVVESPITLSVNVAVVVVPLAFVIVMPSSVGAAAGTLNCSAVADDGVKSIAPSWVWKLGVRIMFSATVPDWRKICDPWPAKFALVLLAGITNDTVLPPVEN